MIASNLIVRNTFIFARVFIFIEALPQLFLQWLKVSSLLIVIVHIICPVCAGLHSLRGTLTTKILIFLNHNNLTILCLVDLINQAFQVLHVEIKLSISL